MDIPLNDPPRIKNLTDHAYDIFTENVKWEGIPPFIPTSTDDRSLKYICASGGSQKSIFEFGTWIGRSALGFSQNYQRVVTMDFAGGSDIAYSYEYEGRKLNPGELINGCDNVNLIIADSRNFDFTPLYGLFDVVYVDGNHSREGCTKDLETAMLISKPKSTIFVDDYPNDQMGVREAVDNFPHPNKSFIPEIGLVKLINYR